MPATYQVGETTIEVKNVIFKYLEFYHFMLKLFEERQYFILEKKYSYNPEKTKMVDFFWQALKNVDDYNRFVIEVSVTFNTLEDVNVLKGKVKIKKNKGSGTIKLRSFLKTDYDSKWEQHAILNFFKVLFENVFEKKSIEEYKNVLKNEMYEIENEIKSYFDIVRLI